MTDKNPPKKDQTEKRIWSIEVFESIVAFHINKASRNTCPQIVNNKGISDEAKKKRAQEKWELIMNATDNFGRGWHTTDRSRPGLGGGAPRQHRVTFSDTRVYGGRNKKTTKKK